MVFSSVVFLFAFLPIALALYFVAPRALRNHVLIVASLFLYAWGEPGYAWLLPVTIAGNYVVALGIARSQTPKLALGLAVAGNLALLAGFKYVNFVAANLNPILTFAGVPTLNLRPIHLPLGISFFTFQAISYLVDVYRGAVPVERSPVRYALYAALFPHLIAGPIVRYRDLADRLGDRSVTLDSFAEGVRRFVVGLGKKLLLANTLATAADDLFAVPPVALGVELAWLALACYTLQIYFDFSGYSDMAIGLGKLFGFDFAENFRHPYSAVSVTDFWRRWHMTLSSWFRDYVYIPLGGNRCGPARTVFNLVIVFVLCGLWHGAAWTFVLWGLWHGAFLVLERSGVGRVLLSGPRPLAHAYTLLAVMGGWVLFRAESLSHAAGFYSALAGGAAGEPLWAYAGRDVWLALTVGFVCCLPVGGRLRGRLPAAGMAWREAGIAAVEFLGYAAVLFGSVLCLAAGTYTPFLYFRF